MMVKKVFVMMVVVLSMIAIFAINAHASAWYTCTVEMAGPGWSVTYIKLTDTGGAFTHKWFRALSYRQKELLAVALTAMTNNMHVLVNVDISESPYPTLGTMYLIKP